MKEEYTNPFELIELLNQELETMNLFNIKKLEQLQDQEASLLSAVEKEQKRQQYIPYEHSKKRY